MIMLLSVKKLWKKRMLRRRPMKKLMLQSREM